MRWEDKRLWVIAVGEAGKRELGPASGAGGVVTLSSLRVASRACAKVSAVSVRIVGNDSAYCTVKGRR